MPGTPRHGSPVDFEPVRPVVAKNAAPHRAVQVDGENLLSPSRDVPDQMPGLPGVCGEQVWREMRLRVDAQTRVGDREPVGDECVEINHDDARMALGQAQQPDVRLAPQRAERRAGPVVDQLRLHQARQRDGVEDQRAASGLTEARGQSVEEAELVREGLPYVVGPPGRGHLVEHNRWVEHAQHEVGLGGIQSAAGIAEVENVRAEIRDHRAQEQPMACRLGGERGNQRAKRAVPGDRDGHRRRLRMCAEHLVHVEPRQQLPGAAEPVGGKVVEQLVDPGIFGHETPVTMQPEYRVPRFA